jgi:hypothetical protein
MPGKCSKLLNVGFWLCAFVTPLIIRAQELEKAKWDIAVWAAGASGEEHTNSFSEAQILSAGVFAGRILTSDMGRGWWRGRLEYGL